MKYILYYFISITAGADARRHYNSMEEEDDLLQFAIQQSLIEAGTEKEEVCFDNINSKH